MFSKIQEEYLGSNCAGRLLPKVYEYGGRIPQTKKNSDADDSHVLQYLRIVVEERMMRSRRGVNIRFHRGCGREKLEAYICCEQMYRRDLACGARPHPDTDVYFGKICRYSEVFGKIK